MAAPPAPVTVHESFTLPSEVNPGAELTEQLGFDTANFAIFGPGADGAVPPPLFVPPVPEPPVFVPPPVPPPAVPPVFRAGAVPARAGTTGAAAAGAGAGAGVADGVAEGVAGAVVVVAVDAAGATECAEPLTSPQALRLTAASAARPARAKVWVGRDIGGLRGALV
jgi:hypothetical protein